MKKIRAILIDDHMFVRQGVKTILEATDDIEVVGEAADGETGINLIDRLMPDVVILDLKLPGSSGAELCWDIARISPNSSILILSAFLNTPLLKTCLAAGAQGYLLKDAQGLDIASTVRILANGGTVFDERVNALSRELIGSPGGFSEALSPREFQVLSLLCKGLTNQEISEELNITLNTTKGYTKEIMRKMNCRNRVEVVICARENNLI